ncbi:ScbR family autoregulator-binding transcription factor [Streptomyces sp. NPDC059009]|uniref:ScbR family autoregulator-binding transcription factor n=1 Tax=Streptomyces sp. NPDC059009 TaxID=3346694 RepID=UPI0036814DC9
MAKQERAVRTRNALIESAAELFDRDGFEVASLATISARAGVSNGALHFHFSSKAALADAVAQAAAERLRQIMAQDTEGALQALIDATHDLIRGLSQDVVLRAGFDLSDNIEQPRPGEDLRRTWQSWVEDVLARADGEGALASGVSAEDVVTAVVAATVGFETLGSQDERWLSHATLTRFWALMLPRLVEASSLDVLVAAGTRSSGVH